MSGEAPELHFPPWKRLRVRAERIVEATLGSLPEELRTEAAAVPVSFLPEPGEDLVADGLDPDLLGLFVGETRAERGLTPHPLPPQILLFLDNLWSYVEGDAEAFAEEVRTTYLHELGHYLGLDEGDLEARGLE